MRNKLIAGNWKMNKTVSEALELVKSLHFGIQFSEVQNIEVVVAPTFLAINKVADFLKDSFISVAAQDLFWEDAGAFTGQVSAPLLKEAGAEYVIIGHSERRQYFHETDTTVNKKTKAALKHQLLPIVCVGETLEEREAGKVRDVVQTQITQGLANLSAEEASKLIIAYEPVWAIGTGKTATPEQAEEVHAMLREMLTQMFGATISQNTKILYGGSVKASNAKEILSKPNIDGALVGGASLKAEDFIGIIVNAKLT